jgi:hypothetical protein
VTATALKEQIAYAMVLRKEERMMLRRAARTWPLHAKEVGSVSVTALMMLPTKTASSKTYFENAWRWMSFEGVDTAPLLTRQLPEPCRAFPRADIALMAQRVKIERHDPSQPFMTVRGSWRPEHELEDSQRRRPLFEPTLNDVFGRDTLDETMHSERDTRRANGAAWFPEEVEETFSFDQKGWYDQFDVPKERRNLLVFRDCDGILWRLCKLPMGYRHACSIAQGATWVIIDFDRSERVRADTCIDNMRMRGPRTDVREAVLILFRRCEAVNATLNDVDTTRYQKPEDLDELVVHSENFLGEFYDYSAGTVAVTAKLLTKLKASMANFAKGWSYRNLAAHIGMLSWTIDILQTDVTLYFDFLRFYRRAASDMAFVAEQDDMWDLPIPEMTRHECGQLVHWTNLVFENKPTSNIRRDGASKSGPRTTIIVDSSSTRWGAVSVRNGKIQVASGEFANEKAASAHAEPSGVKAAIARFIAPHEEGEVVVYTDHMPIAYAAERGVAKAFFTNELFRFVVPFAATFWFRWVPGTTMIATGVDGLSRDAVELGKDEQQAIMRMIAEEWEAEKECGGVRGPHNLPLRHKPSFMV